MRTLLLFIGVCVSAADWPTYRGDDARSGVSTEQLKLPLKIHGFTNPCTLHGPRGEDRPKQIYTINSLN